jgi:dihydroneopterin aldolase
MDLRSESESGAESFSESDVSMDRELWTSTAEWKQKYVVNTDTIQVQDLADSKNIIPNAWGTSKRQPVLISVRIHLSKPFDDSAEKDALTPATVHYGNLCKVLLALPDDTILLGPPKPYSLFIYATLLRKQVYSFMQLSGSLANFQGLQLEIVLPKASLLGNGIGLKDYTSYRAGRNDIQLEDGRANALMINRLHIPTLIGVNSYERGAKQMVIVDAEVDPARHMPDEAASEIEQIITKVFFQLQLVFISAV